MDDLPGDDDQAMEAGNYDLEEDALQRAQDEMFSNSNEMDVDDEHQSDDEQPQSEHHASIIVERPIIDVDYIVQNFKGMALVIRLMHIAEVCPPLRAEVLRMCLTYLIKETQDTVSYNNVYQKIEHYMKMGMLNANEHFPPVNHEWLEKTLHKSNTRLDALNADFRRQKDDGIKESIRRALDDVFQQHLAMGNINDALKLYSRGIREYCTTPMYVLQMLLHWITANIYVDQWNRLSIWIPQAERAVVEAIERENMGSSIMGSSTTCNRSSGLIVPSQKTTRTFREMIAQSNAKIQAISALTAMKAGSFKMAAKKFITIEFDNFMFPELLSVNDIATYGALCSLATFTREDLKEKVISSSVFRKFMESEPKLIELLNKFIQNRFGACLDILAEINDTLLLNVYLAPHVKNLFAQIRRRAIIQYFEPYMNADIKTMAAEFRTNADDMEAELVDLIRNRMLDARIDSFNKVLQIKSTNRQVEIYRNSTKATYRLDNLVRSLLIRSTLQQKGCIVGSQDRRRIRENYDDAGQRDGSPNASNRIFAQMKNLVGGSRDTSS
ncbi:PCI domain-containing protein [Aphelenchoides besseyi]|nr:PCI domain-containing protein [Aphelenchoides besseyi]KAI6199439.1 PCI domain-containing protein [Aphelenchoides besseyi]